MDTQEMVRYRNVMEDIKGRIVAIDMIGTPAGEGLPVVVRIESIYLQYRKILELFVFASFVGTPEQYSELYEAYAKHRDAARLLEELGRANPGFYPKPQVGAAFPHLTPADFVELHRRCGEITYAANPLGGVPEFDWYMANAEKWRDRIIALLDVHTTQLAGAGGTHVVRMQGAGQKVVSAPA